MLVRVQHWFQEFMKTYHHILHYRPEHDVDVIAFDKLDGSNIRVEYSHKRGFYKFGSRETMFDERSKPFGFVIKLFKDTVEKPLTEILKKEFKKYLSIVCFFELVGKKSEFGQHDFGNDEFELVLIDVSLYNHGLLDPYEFVDKFKTLNIPKIVYEGPLTEEFATRVKCNEFGLSEGVICKGIIKKYKKQRKVIYHSKIKTKDWLERLKQRYYEAYRLEMIDIERETRQGARAVE